MAFAFREEKEKRMSGSFHARLSAPHHSAIFLMRFSDSLPFLTIAFASCELPGSPSVLAVRCRLCRVREQVAVLASVQSHPKFNVIRTTVLTNWL
jgi:hypothetical protein